MAEGLILISTFFNYSISKREKIVFAHFIKNYISNLFSISYNTIYSFWLGEDSYFCEKSHESYSFLLWDILDLLILILRIVLIFLDLFQIGIVLKFFGFIHHLIITIKYVLDINFIFDKKKDIKETIFHKINILSSLYSGMNMKYHNLESIVLRKQILKNELNCLNFFQEKPEIYKFDLQSKPKFYNFEFLENFNQKQSQTTIFDYIPIYYSISSDLSPETIFLNQFICRGEFFSQQLAKIKGGISRKKLKNLLEFHQNKSVSVLEKIKNFLKMEAELVNQSMEERDAFRKIIENCQI